MMVRRLLRGVILVTLCFALPGCEDEPISSEVCGNAIDDDGDGRVDCADPDCAAAIACDADAGAPDASFDAAPPPDAPATDASLDAAVREDTDAECTNGMDDDADGLIDCADPDCVDLSLCFDGSVTADGALGARLQVEWETPTPSALGGTVERPAFPSYLAHLFGPTRTRPDTELRVVCAQLTNRGGARWDGVLEARLPGYATAVTADVGVDGGRSTRVCVDAALDVTALHTLAAAVDADIEAELRDAGGAVVGTFSQPVRLLSGSELLWQHADVSLASYRDLASVFVERGDPAALSFAQAASMRSRFSSGLVIGDEPAGYFRTDEVRVASPLGPTEHLVEWVFAEDAEILSYYSVSLSGGAAVAEIFSESEYANFAAGMPATPVFSAALVDGGGGTWFGPSAGTAGFYAFVIHPSGAAGSTLGFTRTNTREEVVRDALASVAAEMRARTFDFAPLAADFQTGARPLVRVARSALGEGRTTLDGALLAAAALMRMGLDPALVFGGTRVYVAVRSAPGAMRRWPLMLDSVGGVAAFFETYRAAVDTYDVDRLAFGGRIVDLPTVRGEGIAEITR